MGPKAVFFDVDGVLIDSVDLKGDCFVEVFSDYPTLKVQVRSWHEKNGGVNREDKILAISRDVIGITENHHEIAIRVKKYENLIVDQVVRAPEIPGAGLVLTALKGRIPLFATSATPEDELKRILAARGDDHYFTSVYGWPVTKKAAIESALERISLKPFECVLVGDSIQDSEAARATGVRFILVAGQSHHQICEADAFIKDLTALLPALERLAFIE